MAISFIGSASNGGANADVAATNLPGGMAVDDLILVMHCDGDTTDNVMPAPTTAGYTDVGTSEQYANGSGGDSNSKAWYKFHNGTDTQFDPAGTGGGANCGASFALMVFRGVATVAQGGPFSTTPTKVTGTGSGNADNPQIATAAGDAVVIMAAAATASTNIGTFTAPANYTTNANLGTAGSDTIEAKAAMAYRLSGYANPENPAAWALSGSAAGDSWTAVTLALKEAPAAPIAYTQAAETDSAFAFGIRLGFGVALETDLAGTIALASPSISYTAALETDSATGLALRLGIGVTSETDAAQGLAARLGFGVSSQIDLATGLAERLGMSFVSEADLSGTLSLLAGGISYGAALETDTVPGPGLALRLAVALPQEADTALAIEQPGAYVAPVGVPPPLVFIASSRPRRR